jgi:RhtB (resistance to homoserine/threonine) family protein
MFDSQVLAFAAIAAVLTISPGADTLLVIRNVVTRGRRAGVTTALGICSGLFMHATLSALGLSVLIAHSAFAYQLLKIAGAVYLVWLGLQSLSGALRGDYARGPNGRTVQQSTSAGQSFAEGLLTNLLNPKVAVFYLALLPQFVTVDDPVFIKSIFLAGIHAAMGVLWLVALASLLDRARAVIARPRARRLLEGVSGSILIGLGARLALSER